MGYTKVKCSICKVVSLGWHTQKFCRKCSRIKRRKDQKEWFKARPGYITDWREKYGITKRKRKRTV